MRCILLAGAAIYYCILLRDRTPSDTHALAARCIMAALEDTSVRNSQDKPMWVRTYTRTSVWHYIVCLYVYNIIYNKICINYPYCCAWERETVAGGFSAGKKDFMGPLSRYKNTAGLLARRYIGGTSYFYTTIIYVPEMVFISA